MSKTTISGGKKNGTPPKKANTKSEAGSDGSHCKTLKALYKAVVTADHGGDNVGLLAFALLVRDEIETGLDCELMNTYSNVTIADRRHTANQRIEKLLSDADNKLAKKLNDSCSFGKSVWAGVIANLVWLFVLGGIVWVYQNNLTSFSPGK